MSQGRAKILSAQDQLFVIVGTFKKRRAKKRQISKIPSAQNKILRIFWRHISTYTPVKNSFVMTMVTWTWLENKFCILFPWNVPECQSQWVYNDSRNIDFVPPEWLKYPIIDILSRDRSGGTLNTRPANKCLYPDGPQRSDNKSGDKMIATT